MITDVIKNFPSQFAYEPVIENGDALAQADSYVIAGMGGSALPADLVRPYSTKDIFVHRGYGVPHMSDALLKQSVYIAMSYSGNTEETVDAFLAAQAKGLQIAVIASGGKLLAFARECRVPYIAIPNTGIQPRHALGYMLMALVRLMGDTACEKDIAALASSLDTVRYETQGKTLAEAIRGKVPVIYASSEHAAVAYNWKIKCNESAKIPAFCGVFSELNHNEMTGLDVIAATQALSEKLHFIFLTDAHDHPRIAQRMELTARLYRDRGLPVTMVALEDGPAWHRVFSSLCTADWMAYHCAIHYGTEPEQVPMVEEFKKILA